MKKERENWGGLNAVKSLINLAITERDTAVLKLAVILAAKVTDWTRAVGWLHEVAVAKVPEYYRGLKVELLEKKSVYYNDPSEFETPEFRDLTLICLARKIIATDKRFQ